MFLVSEEAKQFSFSEVKPSERRHESATKCRKMRFQFVIIGNYNQFTLQHHQNQVKAVSHFPLLTLPTAVAINDTDCGQLFIKVLLFSRRNSGQKYHI